MRAWRQHVGCFPLLEDEICHFGFDGLPSGRSRDRLDASGRRYSREQDGHLCFDSSRRIWLGICPTGTERCMSTSSPVRTRQPRRTSRLPQARSNPSPRRGAVVVRSILLVVAAVSVIATSNYLAYLIGRKQVTYEELRRQVDRVVQLIDEKRVEDDLAATTLKQRQERLEQNAQGLSGLTTSTINGKTTVVAPEPAPAEGLPPAAPIEAKPVARPDSEASLQPPESSPNATTKHRDTHGVAHQRGPGRAKAPKRAPTEALAEQPGQSTTATAPTPDAGLAGQ